MTNAVRTTDEQALTKLSYVVIYPLGGTTIGDEHIDNQTIATRALEALVIGGGISMPSGCGWQVYVVNNDTGEITRVGETE